MKRGDLVTIAVSGDYGKPRPALVVQDDAFAELSAVTVLRLTGELNDWPLFRIMIEPTPQNGLLKPSQVMIDRGIALPRTKVGPVFGQLSTENMMAVSQALYRFFGLHGIKP
ncbi:type II toxin-antitoxin system PemK/MazF family toxin [Bosea vaviloviae]|uniref:Growth inhibitor PemK n=1 Tax=Bosea vaviloviae TaxID=1526658 RepID=A0A0N1F7A8_9HYPH|nr:type II toxin-antitoxin system PemK/MazF family toxin [Bosea vaviloviae]KPH83082.1 growth inhibitor PemK [Bosea vaviloviae]